MQSTCSDSFINALLLLEMLPDNKNSIISQSLVKKFTTHNFDEIGYNIAQLFEPGTIVEIGLLLNKSEQSLLDFEYPKSKNIEKLTWLITNREYLTAFTKINLAHCLISLCRYALAKEILESVNYEQLPRNFKFYYLAANFFISNRFEDGVRSNHIFSEKRQLIETGDIDQMLILQSCTQAIVWNIKAKEISKDNLDFFVSLGQKIIDTGIDTTSCHSKALISGWYRALAMIPACNNDMQTTREYMQFSKTYAEQIAPKNESEDLAKRHMLKTYYESEMKEFLYFHKDWKAAEQSGLNMITQDPYWSLSWAEMGELYCKEKDYDKALDAYSKSFELGAPRKIRSYFHMGNCKALLGDHEEAIHIFNEILTVDVNNISAALAGFKYSKMSNHSQKNYFSSSLDGYIKKGLISNDKINQLVAA